MGDEDEIMPPVAGGIQGRGWGERQHARPVYQADATIVRKAHAVRIVRSRDPRHNWRITEVTPAVLKSAAPEPHTIDPVHVQIFRASSTGPVLVLYITDPMNTYFNR